jgi:hypothetical protein
MQKVQNRTVAYARMSLFLLLPGFLGAQSFPGVLTGQYDNNRSGSNLEETILTPSNVSASNFGLLFTQAVDANVFAQPLYVPNLTIKGKVHNVVYLATINNSVYAFDADTSQAALWHVTLGKTVDIGFPASPNIGILSTPVIDTSLNLIFVVTLGSGTGSQLFELWALNLQTGAPVAHTPIQGAINGTGDNSQSTSCAGWNGTVVEPPCIPFMPGEQLQRPALLEDPSTATVFIGFGTRSGQEAVNPYHGWMFGYQYSAGVLTQTMIFTTTQNATQTGLPCSADVPPLNECGHGGGIWMSGRGPALDSTGLYFITGNGGFGGAGTGNWGESALRLSESGAVEDSFTPSNYSNLNNADLDLSDGGAILFTSSNAAATDLLLLGGKTGILYVLNRASLGGFSSTNKGVVQSFSATSAGCGTGPGQNNCFEIHGMAFWARSSADPVLYVWAYGDSLRVWDFNPGTNKFALDPHQGNMVNPNYPGAGLSISANGDTNGILWAILPVAGAGGAEEGGLYAFNAANVTTPLWNSTDYWFTTKFTSPTVANGKVYIPTSVSPTGVTPSSSPQLRVYGLCSACTQAAPK